MTDSIETRYRVTGMDCGSCAAKVEAVVRRLPQVEAVSVSATTGTMTLQHHAQSSPLATLKANVTPLGYDIFPIEDDDQAPAAGHQNKTQEPHSHSHEHGAEGPWWRTRKAWLTIACGFALLLAYAMGKLAPVTERWVFIAAMVIGLAPIARRAFLSARARIPFSIEMLMTIAAVGAVLIDAAEEAAVVVFLFLLGELLEGVAASQARASIKSLTTLIPATAHVETGETIQEVPAEKLEVGSIIRVRPGDRIAADGEIVEGEGAIDEALVTGESAPVRKGTGGNVFAGTINTDSVLRVRVTAAAAENTIARVVRLVEEAQESKAPTERFIDRFSRYYTPGVVAVATVVAVVPPLLFGAAWTDWIYKGLAILLIGCPCALVISTPAAIAAGLSAGARRGLLIKGGAVLETLGKITAAALDKTGTLTEGRPKVTDVVGLGRSAEEVLTLAAALEHGSNHPLALAILERVNANETTVPPVTAAAAVAGRGVTGTVGGNNLFFGSAQAANERVSLDDEQSARVGAFNREGKTVSILLAGNAVAGLIAMRDEPRSDAKQGIQALKALGITPIMLTGDNRRTADAIAKHIGIDVRAELLPEDKQRIVREMQQASQVVAKVGDGINDAPALAAADVGIAMGGGTDVALETADAAVLHGRVLDIPRMVELSKATMRNIHQNITIALGLKAVFLVTTILGITGLWPAILADTGATVLVTGNAIRLLRW